MITFLLILILVFVGVDLLVRLVIDPLASGSAKKNKVSKSFTSRFDPTISLASETMYDGGKLHNETYSSNASEKENISKDAGSSLK
ncbi:MAG: hypothetical protein M0Q21_07915 [Ignavibacteriaceae bacterium]|nr:hypothetical protein [Ignavibacteriaceae bacterium]